MSAALGEAVIPFAASGSGPQTAVLIAADDFAALATLHLQSESYSLAAGAGAWLYICGHCICVEHSSYIVLPLLVCVKGATAPQAN